MKCLFVVGQKVVCVNSTWYQCNPYAPDCGRLIGGPREGQIYTITWIGVEDLFPDMVYVKLREFSDHMQYTSDAFRPLQDRPKKTSIEVFKKLCDPTHKVLETIA